MDEKKIDLLYFSYYLLVGYLSKMILTRANHSILQLKT